MIFNIFKGSLTTSDNESGDVIKIGFGVSLLVFLGLEIVNYSHFNATSFSAAIGVLFTSASGALYIKKSTEP